MHFQVDPKVFKQALSVNDKLIGGLNFDNCILTTESKENLSLYSHSKDCWVKTLIPAKVTKKGQVNTQAGVLYALTLSGKEVDFSVNSDSKLEFKCGRTKGFIETNPSIDGNFEKPPAEVKLTNKFSLDDFKSLVEAMSYDSDIVEISEVKPISFRSDGKYLRMSTHDNYCMGYAEVKAKNLTKFEAILPFKLLNDIVTYVTKDFEFGISETDEKIRVKTDELDLIHSYVRPTAALIDMDTQLKAIKDEKNFIEMTVDKDAVDSKVKELISFSHDQAADTKIDFTADKEKKICFLNAKTIHGGIKSNFKLASISKTLKATASLWLFASFLEKMQGETSIRFLGNKILFMSGSRYYVMPTISK